VLPDWSSTWLVAGLLLGGALSVLVGAAFVVGQRLYPDATQAANRRTSGEARRRTEIREFFDAIGEPYVENRSIAGQPVAFYLPERDVAITFDVEAFFRIRRTGRVAILYEHEMPVGHLAARLPFEVPEITRPSRTDGRDSVRTAFETLEVPVGVGPDRIDEAYRDRIKESHPDHGGDEAEFRRVREAYAVAKEYADSRA
jgi:hypothetical protein